ncbi:M15 family metallopeptidase [Arthrobacter zhaoguopingii]|uniref:M15 family metallopeptidase n=1 Tax=Arthrobacter zhaoguopingii TaxID=2681491 RepID=UPI00135A5297|nr:M15 family metallopeptidase [Arthrobacter zhaoguopingii]
MRTPGQRRLGAGPVAAAVLAVLLTGCGGGPDGSGAGAPASTAELPAPAQRSPAAAPAKEGTQAAAPAPAKAGSDNAASDKAKPDKAHSDPASPGVVVNKRRPLSPQDFVPPKLVVPRVERTVAAERVRLRPDAAAAVEKMFAAAAADGVGLTLVSGYRSFEEQAATYNHWVGQYGDEAQADEVSARAGHSEHQTGLAFDIGQADGTCTLVLCFRDTEAARWTAQHAARYGFILRYPQGHHEVTGFSAESWHFRYVGPEIAAAMKAAGTATLEEHFGLPPAPGY